MELPEEHRTCTGHSQSSNSPVEEINLYCKVIKTVAVKVKRSETIKSLKVILGEKEGISENFQELFFADNRLKDEQMLIDCGINKNSTLHLIVNNSAIMKICVRIPSKEKTIAFEVKTWETIQEIKTMIQTKEGIPLDEFSLYFNGEKLDDDSNLASLNIERKSTLYLVFNPRDVFVSIFVKGQTGNVERLKVRLLHTVQDIKEIFESMTDDSIADSNLTYAGKKLEGHKTLAHYEIKEGSLLQISQPFLINVRISNNRLLSLIVESEDTVRDLMHKICQETGYRVNDQSIIFAEKNLKKEQNLANYGIKKDSDLLLVVHGR